MMCLQSNPDKGHGDVAAASGHRRTVSENRRQNCRKTAPGLGLAGFSKPTIRRCRFWPRWMTSGLYHSFLRARTIDRLQFNVLEICRDCGEETLARHCMDLALKNPCLEEQWRKRYTQVLAAAPSSKRTKPPARALARPPVSTQKKPAGESYYQFCNVQFKEDGATYAYLTGGISLKAGDFVVVPIGDHQAEKLARVTEVFVCSTQNAPYPPEKAKFVLRQV